MVIYNTIKTIGGFIFLLLFVRNLQAQCYVEEHSTTNNPLDVSIWSTCPNEWNLTMTAVNRGAPYCTGGPYGCYQFNLFKDGVAVAQSFSNSPTNGFAVPANDNSVYALRVTTMFYGQNSCGGIWTIYYDWSAYFTNYPFCAQNVTYSNVSSGTGTLMPETKANDYILTQDNVTASSGTDVKFYSTSIVLGPGFLAESGSNFLAENQSCTVTSSCASKIAAGTNQYFDSTEPLASESSGNIDVNVFPNPSSGVFQIYTGDFKGLTGNVEVFNSLGEKVLILAEGETIEENYIINGNNLSGIYNVKISSDNKNIVKRILITRNY